MTTLKRGMTVTIESVSPAIAKNWVKRNINNRALRRGHVQSLAAAMKAGDFPFTHQGIAFDKDGNLLDGQHRLHAVIESGVTVKFMVIRGADRETFPYLDQAARRNTADQLGIDQRTSEVVLMIGRLIYGNKPSPQQLQAVHDAVAEVCAALYSACSGSRKIYSSTSMRVAAVTSVLMGEQRDYVFGIFRNLVNCHFNDVPPIANSLVGQVQRGTISAQEKADLLSRGMKVFRAANAHLTKLQVNDPTSEMDFVRTFYRERIGAQG